MSRQPLPFKKARRQFEEQYVTRVLHFTEGNVSHAAEVAGKDRKDFYDLMYRNGIKPAKFRRK